MKSSHFSQSFSGWLSYRLLTSGIKDEQPLALTAIIFFSMIRNFPLPQLLLCKCPTLGWWSPPFKQPVLWGGRSLMGIGLDQQNINTSRPLLTTFPTWAHPSYSLSLLLQVCPFPLPKPFAAVYACPFYFFPSCFISCLPPGPLYVSYSWHQVSTGLLTGFAGLLPTAALKPFRSEVSWENSNMRNQTHFNYEEGWLGERAFLLSPAKCFAILLEDSFFLYRKIHFWVFWQEAEILYGKQMVCVEILYKQERSLPLNGSVTAHKSEMES